MKTLVLDASVALRWFLDKSIPPYAVRIRALLLDGGRGLVPSLWHLEMANALVVAERRKSLSAADLELALQRIEQMLTHSIDTDTALVSSRQACLVARSWHLSGYDAAYLHLAQRTGLPLATLDEELILAARKCGINTL